MMSDVVVITAAGVGGGSLVYANVQLRAPADVFDEPHWPAAITGESIEPWYQRTEAALEPVTTPPDPALRKMEAFAAAGRHVGKERELLPIAVHFGEPRAHPFSGVQQGGCENLARCDIGCPVHAKNTIDITYVARAESLGAEVFPLHSAERIEPPEREGGMWRVGFEDLESGHSGSVEARTLVLAAGALGSPRMLLKNQRRLPKLSSALGTRFSGNGDALGIAFDAKAEDVKNARNDFGPVMTSALNYTTDRKLILADGGLPPGFHGILDIARAENVITGWRRWLVRLRNLVAHLGWTDQALQPARPALARNDAGADDPEPGCADLPDVRPRRGGRSHASDAAAAALRHPLEQGGQPEAVRASSSTPRVSWRRAPMPRPSTRSRPVRSASS